MEDPAQIESVLAQGAARARAVATPFLQQIRHAVGIRPLA
jgi:tryptophanyl-tRNA synthetase